MLEAYRIVSEPYLKQSFFTEGFIEGFDGKKIYTVSWMPKSRPSAIIIVIHGLGDHIQRYHSLAHFYNDNQIGVVGMDLPGHGKSTGKRGAIRYSKLLKQMRIYIDQVQKQYPGIPKILYGHCLGGSLVLNHCIRNKPDVAGIIASSPWLKSAKRVAKVTTLFSKILLRIYPSFRITWRAAKTSLTRSTREEKSMEHDELTHPYASLRLLTSLEEEGKCILKSKHRINLPLLLMHGNNDNITSWKTTAEFAKFTSSNTTLKLWKGLNHELHHENINDAVLEYTLIWMKTHFIH